MDYNKITLIGLILLVLMPTAVSQLTYEDIFVQDDEGLTEEIDYTQTYHSFGFKTVDGQEEKFLIAGSQPNLETTSLVFKVTSPTIPAPDVNLTYQCLNKSQFTFNLSNYATWANEGKFFGVTQIDFVSNTTFGVWLSECNFTTDGSDAYVDLYIYPTTIYTQGIQYEHPSPELATLVGENQYSGTREILSIGFSLMSIMMVITGIFFLSLLIVFTFKVMEYLSYKVSGRSKIR